MQALILAAGRGSRLGKITDATPKCLLQIGRQPIIVHQLQALAEAGVAPVAMVVGYCGDEIREIVGIRAEYIDNPKWNTTNSLYSFVQARDWIKGPVVVLNSDVIFHPKILHRVVAAGGDAIAYDSSSEKTPEQMKVRVVDGQLIDMSKDMEPDLASGENLGILCFTAETVRVLMDRAAALLASGGEQSWLSAAVRDVARERRIQAVDIAGLPWAEIDSAQDLQAARRQVWPAIRKGRSRLRRICQMTALAALIFLVATVSVFAVRAARPGSIEVWEPIELRGAPTISLMAGNRKQTWWLLGKDPVLTETVGGPGKVRVESRLLLAKGVSEAIPYMLAVEVDDELMDWFKKSGKPSETWTHAEWIIAKQRSIDIDVPAGSHTLRIAFMGTAKGPCCAIRLSQSEPPDPD